jgi:hypothetical protein
MNTIRATVFLLALILSGGCVSVVPKGMNLACESRPITPIKISYKRHSNIKVRDSDSKVYVKAGDAINYIVTGPEIRTFNAKGTSGPGPYSWLDVTGGSGEPRGKSHIKCVPEDQATGDYEYEIEIVGVGTLDPTVHVNK